MNNIGIHLLLCFTLMTFALEAQIVGINQVSNNRYTDLAVDSTPWSKWIALSNRPVRGINRTGNYMKPLQRLNGSILCGSFLHQSDESLDSTTYWETDDYYRSYTTRNVYDKYHLITADAEPVIDALGTLYYGTSQGIAVCSGDDLSLLSFVDLTSKMNMQNSVNEICISKQGVIYASGDGLYRSTDRGVSWQYASVTIPRLEYPGFCTGIKLAPNGTILAYFSYDGLSRLFYRTFTSIAMSTDFGQTWSKIFPNHIEAKPPFIGDEPFRIADTYCRSDKMYFTVAGNCKQYPDDVRIGLFSMNYNGDNRVRISPENCYGAVFDSSGGLTCFTQRLGYPVITSSSVGGIWDYAGTLYPTDEMTIDNYQIPWNYPYNVDSVYSYTTILHPKPIYSIGLSLLANGHVIYTPDGWVKKKRVRTPPLIAGLESRCGEYRFCFISDSLSSVQIDSAKMKNALVAFDTLRVGRSIRVIINAVNRDDDAVFSIYALNSYGEMSVVNDTIRRKPVVLLRRNGEYLDAGRAIQYRWFRDDVLIMDSISTSMVVEYARSTIKPSVIGLYRCEVFDSTGCVQGSNVVSVTSVTSVSEEQVESRVLHVIPSPAADRIQVLGLKATDQEYCVVDVLGNVLLRTVCSSIDTSELPNGVYSIQVTNSRYTSNCSFMISR